MTSVSNYTRPIRALRLQMYGNTFTCFSHGSLIMTARYAYLLTSFLPAEDSYFGETIDSAPINKYRHFPSLDPFESFYYKQSVCWQTFKAKSKNPKAAPRSLENKTFRFRECLTQKEEEFTPRYLDFWRTSRTRWRKCIDAANLSTNGYCRSGYKLFSIGQYTL